MFMNTATLEENYSSFLYSLKEANSFDKLIQIVDKFLYQWEYLASELYRDYKRRKEFGKKIPKGIYKAMMKYNELSSKIIIKVMYKVREILNNLIIDLKTSKFPEREISELVKLKYFDISSNYRLQNIELKRSLFMEKLKLDKVF